MRVTKSVLTELVEALSSLGDLPAAPLQLPLQPLAQVQDPNDPAQQVTGHLHKTHNQQRPGHHGRLLNYRCLHLKKMLNCCYANTYGNHGASCTA